MRFSVYDNGGDELSLWNDDGTVTLKLDREAADFLLSLYGVLDVGGPAEKSLSDFADQLLDSNGPSKEYEFYAGGVHVERFRLTWREPKENKAR